MKRWIAGGVAVIVIAIIAGLVVVSRMAPEYARRELIRVMKDRFESDVDVNAMAIDLFPRISIRVDKLTFRHHGRTDVPPLAQMEGIVIDTGWSQVLAKPRVIEHLTLKGLTITIPPRYGRREVKPPVTGVPAKPDKETPVLVSHVWADGTMLRILPKDPGKEPLEYDIMKLTLDSVGIDRPMNYHSQLRNAKPPGVIFAQGQFGPWAEAEPGDTFLNGEYTMKDADLGVFKGIAGKLSSEGKFEGVLGKIAVHGTTDSPDFTVQSGNHPVRLQTKFEATVDGTDGDTYLHPVEATWRGTVLLAKGGIYSKAGRKGKTVSLDAVVNKGRIEDVMQFAIKQQSPLRGALQFRSKIEIPPGDVDISQKLYLNGAFGLSRGKFTSTTLQEKIDDLSVRTKGKPKEVKEENEDVASNLSGKFVLKNGVVQLNGLSFRIPGAAIQLAGSYAIQSEALDFKGVARTQAKVSQMTTGWKSLLLKAADPFFKKNGAGAEIPIKIGGTREQPSFGLRLRDKKSSSGN